MILSFFHNLYNKMFSKKTLLWKELQKESQWFINYHLNYRKINLWYKNNYPIINNLYTILTFISVLCSKEEI